MFVISWVHIRAALRVPCAVTIALVGSALITFAGAPLASASSATANRAVTAAMNQQGTPYRHGGASPGGFDCSGLIKWSYRQAGVNLPRTSRAQSGAGVAVALDRLQPGDVLYYSWGREISHVSLYVGNGRIVEASRPGKPVAVRAMYRSGLKGARRMG